MELTHILALNEMPTKLIEKVFDGIDPRELGTLLFGKENIYIKANENARFVQIISIKEYQKILNKIPEAKQFIQNYKPNYLVDN